MAGIDKVPYTERIVWINANESKILESAEDPLQNRFWSNQDSPFQFLKETGTPQTDKIKYGTRTLAQQWLTYGITRKVTKRPVMTLAYGAKEYGFNNQISANSKV